MNAVAPVAADPWSRSIGGPGVETIAGVAVDAAGNVVLAGTFTETLTIGATTHIAAGEDDVFIAKLSAGGVPRWSKHFGAATAERVSAVALDPEGNVFVAGAMLESVDFGRGGLPFAGGSDVFVVKLGPGGEPLWSRSLGGIGRDANARLAFDAAGNVVVAAEFSDKIALGDFVAVSLGRTDVFVVRLGAKDGLPSEGLGLGGTSADSVSGLAVGVTGVPLVAGAFAGSLKIGAAPLESLGGDDTFLARLGAVRR